MKKSLWRALAFAVAASPAAVFAQYTVTNLVSDGFVPALHTDPNLVNGWGISSSPSGPFWVSDNGTWLSTVYDTHGNNFNLNVKIKDSSNGNFGPVSGQAFNGTSGFKIGGKSTHFLFATEDGTISGWTGGGTTESQLAIVKNGASYKGLAIGTDASNNNYLFATDFAHGTVDRYDSNFHLTSANFLDPTLPTGFDPYNVSVIGGKVYVTYAMNNGNNDSGGTTGGFVDEFNMDGTFVKRLASGGTLDQPWGLAIAPSTFKGFAGDLLVGNFGDGTINAFNFSTGHYDGQLTDVHGNVIHIDGLWGLINGNGGLGGAKSAIYFAAGPGDENHGLFGAINAVPEPTGLIPLALICLGLFVRKARS